MVEDMSLGSFLGTPVVQLHEPYFVAVGTAGDMSWLWGQLRIRCG